MSVIWVTRIYLKGIFVGSKGSGGVAVLGVEIYCGTFLQFFIYYFILVRIWLFLLLQWWFRVALGTKVDAFHAVACKGCCKLFALLMVDCLCVCTTVPHFLPLCPAIVMKYIWEINYKSLVLTLKFKSIIPSSKSNSELSTASFI